MSSQDTSSSTERRASERIFKQQMVLYPGNDDEEKRMLIYALRTMIKETNHPMRKHIYVSRVLTIKEKILDYNTTLKELHEIAGEVIRSEHIKYDEDFGMTYS